MSYCWHGFADGYHSSLPLSRLIWYQCLPLQLPVSTSQMTSPLLPLTAPGGRVLTFLFNKVQRLTLLIFTQVGLVYPKVAQSKATAVTSDRVSSVDLRWAWEAISSPSLLMSDDFSTPASSTVSLTFAIAIVSQCSRMHRLLLTIFVIIPSSRTACSTSLWPSTPSIPNRAALFSGAEIY